jgi:thioredoxin 1
MFKFSLKQSSILLIIVGSLLAIGNWQCTGNASNSENKIRVESSYKPETTDNGVIILTTNTFDTQIKKGVVLVDFWAGWCRPCRMQAPVIEEVSNAMTGRATVGKLDIDANSSIADKYGIQSIPTLLIFKDGKVVHQFVGLTPKEEIIAELEKYTETKN